jgi:hypothetical protein
VKRPRKANGMKRSITSLLQNGEQSTPIFREREDEKGKKLIK